MNRQERRLGRMYLLPLLLGLTGISLLVLEWVLRLEGFDAFGELKDTVVHCLPCFIYPAVLLGLYLGQVPPKAGRIFCFVSLGLTLLQFILATTTKNAAPQGILAWFPGVSILYHGNYLRAMPGTGAKLLLWADVCFVAQNLSGVFTCTSYAIVKAKSILRNEAFDRKNAVLLQQEQEDVKIAPPTPAPEPKAVPASDEPTRVVELPEQYR